MKITIYRYAHPLKAGRWLYTGQTTNLRRRDNEHRKATEGFGRAFKRAFPNAELSKPDFQEFEVSNTSDANTEEIIAIFRNHTWHGQGGLNFGLPGAHDYRAMARAAGNARTKSGDLQKIATKGGIARGKQLIWNPQDKQEEIKRLHAAGWTMVRIGKKFGVNDETVARYFLRNGLSRRDKSQATRLSHLWVPKNPKQIIDLYESRIRPSVIAKRFGVSRSGLYIFLKRNKVNIRSISDWKKWQPTNPDDVIYLYVRCRWSTKRIGSKYGVGRGAVLGFLKRQKIQIRNNKFFREVSQGMVQ